MTWILSERLNVFFFDDYARFAILQSRVHELWARFFGSTLEDRLLYTATDCFETFPLPLDRGKYANLSHIGEEYYLFRADMMTRTKLGLTKTYGRFHDPSDHGVEILRLRELHAIMDRAVLNAYGWDKFEPRLDFILEYEVEQTDGEPERRDRRKPWRYRWIDEHRDEVLARLLELNRVRSMEEAQPATSAPAPRNGGTRGAKSRTITAPSAISLFEVEDPTA